MSFKDLIAEKDFATQRDVNVRTLQRERSNRTGPTYIKIGRKFYYRPEDISAWIETLLVKPE